MVTLLGDQTNLNTNPIFLYIEFSPPNFTMLTMGLSWRGCASSFKQPMSKKNEYEAECLRGTIYRKNCEDNGGKRAQVKDVIYRTGDGDSDILRHVFRWEMAPYQEVFRNGLKVKRDTSSSTRPDDDTYFSLLDYVSNAEGLMGLDSREASKWAYISTTISNSWFPPTVNVGGGSNNNNNNSNSSSSSVELYRYEIYAPGGIWLAVTLGDLATTPTIGHHQVVFPIGIASQYIRSVQIFNLILHPNSNGTTKIERVKKEVIINGNFNPQSHPLKLLKVEDPVCDYVVEEYTRAPLKSTVYHPDGGGENANLSSSITEWYSTGGVTKLKSYVDAGFRSHQENAAYYLLKNVIALVDYAPGTNNDKVLDGPVFIPYMFPSLKDTPFGEHRIDCAFGSHDDNEAYVFSANLCAHISYSTDSVVDKIIQGPMPITQMFTCLKGTVFENGIGAAIESTYKNEVILFKGDQCARMLYKADELADLGAVAAMFPSLNGHVLETDLDAAYASHVEAEGSYVFKGNQFAIFYFGPGDDKLVLGPVQIGSEGPGMATLFPHHNRGLDFIPSQYDSPAPVP